MANETNSKDKAEQYMAELEALDKGGAVAQEEVKTQGDAKKSEKAPKAPKAPKALKPPKAPKPGVRRPNRETRTEQRQEVVDFFKSLIAPLIFCAVLAIGLIYIINFVNPETEVEPVIPYGYDGEEDPEPLVMESDDLIFTMDQLTTHFTVEQKSTGKVWSSYIENAAQDTRAIPNEKGMMQSNLVISYGITTGLETVYDSKTYSVDKSVYELEKGDDGSIKVKYSLGNIEREYIMPTVITVAKMDTFREKMEKKDADSVKDIYKAYDIKKLRSSDDKDALLASYPILETEPVYILRDNVKGSRKVKMEEALAAAGYTYEDYQADKELDKSTATVDQNVFNVEMDFRLEGNDLVVEIPFDSIEYNPSTPLYRIYPLPYFGAGSQEDEGFMFVPEGGGAIINYNNGKTAQSDYYANVYGWDMDIRRDYVIHNTRAYFGVFGQACGDSSYICMMENGASYGAVRAFVSGRSNDWNYVDAEYTICPREQFNISAIASSDVFAYLPQLPAGEKIVQRYRFIDQNDYVSMAKTYGDYLRDEYGDYLKVENESQAPVAVELVGAVDKVQQVLGIPMSRPLKLTTFKDADGIIEDLNSENIGDLSVKLTGWCNGGVSQKLLKKVKLVKKLGSSKDLQNLSNHAQEMGVDLYLDGITQYEHNSNILDGFNSFRDAARLLTKERAELYKYSHVTYAAREGFKSYYLLHTDLARKMAANLVKTTDKYSTGVSFQDIGMDLSSDFYRKKTYSRENVLGQDQELLKGLDESGKKIMINMGNDYAVPYADLVVDMELKGSGYTVLDAEIPFYQMALHGAVDYTGESINICGNDQEEILTCAEYGAGLYFTLMKESAFALQKTLYPEYYACEYDTWRDRLVDICTRYNAELGHTFGQRMTGHEVLNEYVRCTSYEDGTKVYVNYSFADEYKAEDGTVVPVRDYVVVR